MVTLWHGGTRPGVHWWSWQKQPEDRKWDQTRVTEGLGAVAHACNPSTHEAEAGSSWFWDKLGLHNNSGQSGFHSKVLTETKQPQTQHSVSLQRRQGQHTVAGDCFSSEAIATRLHNQAHCLLLTIYLPTPNLCPRGRTRYSPCFYVSSSPFDTTSPFPRLWDGIWF